MSKSFFLLSAFFVAATFATAQTSSGNFMFGGGINISSVSRQSAVDADNSSFSFSPSAGYFVGENFAVGLGFTIASEKSGPANNRIKETSFGIGPFARYYFFTSNDQFAIFGQAGLSLANGKTKYSGGDIDRATSTTFSVFPGAAYFFNEHWAVELAITGFVVSAYDPDTNNDNDKVTSVQFGLHSFSPTLGFRYHL